MNKGFTLIETLLVLVIIAMISTLVVMNVDGLLNRVDKQVIETNLRSMQTAMEVYYIQDREYPQTEFDKNTGENYNEFKEELNPYIDVDKLESDLTANDNISYELTSAGYELTITINKYLESITLTERGLGEWEEEI